MEQYQYDAFISYRHRTPDSETAIALQRFLEKRRRPDGSRLRIFRDKTDLPISNSLGEYIENALAGSEYLIVVCSPQYALSKWCMAELEFFRKLHGNSNAKILPVLVEGEPREAFPLQLFWEERSVPTADGQSEIRRFELEPLAADVRGAGRLQRWRKLRTEHLRIAAHILNKSFDDLYQRARRRRLLTGGLALGAAFAGLAAFALYNMSMRTQIEDRHMAMLENESLRLAVASEQALTDGNSSLAMLLALEALPQDIAKPERPLVPEAAAALRSAVYSRMAAETTNPLQSIAVIDFRSYNWDFVGLYDGGSKFAVTDYDRLYLYDAATGALLYDHPSDFFNPAWLTTDASRLVWIRNPWAEGSAAAAEVSILAVPSGEVLYTGQFSAVEDSIRLACKKQNGIFYFYDTAGEDFLLLEAVSEDGSVLADGFPPPDLAYGAEDALTPESDAAMFTQEKAYKLDYDREKGEYVELWSPAGLRHKDAIRSVLGENDRYAYLSEDETLLLTCYSYPTDKDGTVALYFLPDAENGEVRQIVSGLGCLPDAANNRLYTLSEHRLQVYSYDTANSRPEPESQDKSLLVQLSADGQRCTLPEEGLRIYRCSDLASPLVDIPCLQYSLDPQLRYAIVQTAPGQYQVWNIETGLQTEISLAETEENPCQYLCINETGTYAAVALEDGTIHLFSAIDGTAVSSLSTPVNTNFKDDDFFESEYMEFTGDLLLYSGNGNNYGSQRSWLVDASGSQETQCLPAGISDDCYTALDDHNHLTSNGLLFCTGSYINGTLDYIYDIRSGKTVFRQLCYYRYDEASDTLLYLLTSPASGDSTRLHAARRNADGIFEDVYTIDASNVDTYAWREILRCIDGEYFLVPGQQCCHIYRLADGTHLLTLYDETLDVYENAFEFAGGAILDTGHASADAITAYPLLELDTLMAAAKEYLTSPLGTRTLSRMEKEKYFLD